VIADVGHPAYPAGMTPEERKEYEDARDFYGDYGAGPVVRTDEEIRRVLAYARAGIARYGFGEHLSAADLARPWGNGRWQDNAWLRGVRDILAWYLGDVTTGPVLHLEREHPTLPEIYGDVHYRLRSAMFQGVRIPVVPGWPPPQSAEAWEHTLEWLQGRTDEPPATPHGGIYQYNEDWTTEPAVS
jgi:hypothetical protein